MSDKYILDFELPLKEIDDKINLLLSTSSDTGIDVQSQIEDLKDQPDIICRGGSTIISPMGGVLAGPLYDKEGILYADLDRGEIARSKMDFDVVGQYARPDVFRLIVNEEPAPPVEYSNGK